VLEKVGMDFMGSVGNPDSGEVWHRSLRREDYQVGRSVESQGPGFSAPDYL
jgi:hypothetical protein